LRHGANCEVLEPEDLRRNVAAAFNAAAAQYRKR
jgi:predicted DNA-binding transcriptional regulator YafY